MPNAPISSQERHEAARPQTIWAVPGWLVSGGLHAGVLVFLVTAGLPSCNNDTIGIDRGEGDLRQVGLFIKPDENQSRENEQPADNPAENEAQPTEVVSPDPLDSVKPPTPDEAIANLVALPKVDAPAIIGSATASGAPRISTPGSANSLVKPNSVKPPPSGASGKGEVSFMGKTAVGKRVVFVIDSSISMQGWGAIDYAKAKLAASINQLDKTQLFQIIEYNRLPHFMKLGGDTKIKFYRATDHNRGLAARYIRAITPDGGTQHMPALRLGLSLEPDVLFFLTDADTPKLKPAELYEIRTKLSRGKTSIHGIKFGKGPDTLPVPQNFVRTLANQNRGTYSYRNVRQFDAP